MHAIDATVHVDSATDAPAALGGLAAALQVIELEKLLADDIEHALVDRELFVELRHHIHQLTSFRRSAQCRFDHERWQVKRSEDLTLGALTAGGRSLGVERHAIELAATCIDCETIVPTVRLVERLDARSRRCPSCGAGLLAAAGGRMSEIAAADLERLGPAMLDRTIRTLGLRPGDVFRVRAGDTVRRYELTPAAASAAAGAPPGGGACGATVVVVGCGNIGSQVVPHLGRIAGLARVVLVDPDAYEHANLRGQAIEADDVGRSKALVQRERLARIAPDLDGLAICKRIEQVPLGHLRDAIVLACVDSRAARQAINEATWRIGRAWIDAAVDGSQLIARTIVHVPAADGACLECAWSEADYLALETAVPCTEAAVDDAAAVARGEHR